MGPALVKQDVIEARQAVSRRLEFINKEWFVNQFIWLIN